MILLDQEPEASLRGQAHWSPGGLFLVDTPEQRRAGVKDSLELAWRDWGGQRGLRPSRWAERGGYEAIGHGNSVPRVHVTWGHGPRGVGAVRAAPG